GRRAREPRVRRSRRLRGRRARRAAAGLPPAACSAHAVVGRAAATPSMAATYDRGVTDSTLVLVANAGDGSISTFRLTGGRLDRLAVTDGVTGCSNFAIDPVRDLVHAAVKGSGDDEPAGIL